MFRLHVNEDQGTIDLLPGDLKVSWLEYGIYASTLESYEKGWVSVRQADGVDLNPSAIASRVFPHGYDYLGSKTNGHHYGEHTFWRGRK